MSRGASWQRVFISLGSLLVLSACTHAAPPGRAPLPPGVRGHLAPPGDEAAWTILIYMAADDDLEQAAIANIEEMAQAGSNDRVNVVVQIDRAPAGKSGGGYARAPILNLKDFHATKRLRIDRGHVVELADLGETCTCDPEPLAAFVAWGLTAFPSKKAALVLWDHGGASHGYGWDVTNDNLPLSIPDMHRGILAGLSAAGRPRFDILGFDACLMGNIGVAYELRRLADVFIGSEEFEPQAGWSYAPILRAMAAGAAPREVANDIVQSFEESCRAAHADELCTLAAFDTSKLDAVVDALDDLGARLGKTSQNLADWYPIARARTAAEQYGAGAGDQSPFAAVDAVDFATRVSRALHDPDHVGEAVLAATIINAHGPGRPNAHGLSLTFPRQAKERTAPDDALALATRPNARWDAFLRTYLELVDADRTPPTMIGFGIVSSPTGVVDASGQLPDVDLAEVAGVVSRVDAQGVLTLLSITANPISPHVTFHWTRSLPAFGDGEDIVPVTIFEEAPYLDASGHEVRIASLGGALHPHGVAADAINVVVYLKLAVGKRPVLEGVYRREGDGVGSELAIHSDDRLAPSVVTVAVDGRTTHIPSTRTVSLGNREKLALVMQAAPPGDYAVGFRLTDYAANRRWEVMGATIP